LLTSSAPHFNGERFFLNCLIIERRQNWDMDLGESDGTLKYQARGTLVSDDIDYMPEFPVSSFSVRGTSVVYLVPPTTKLLSE